MRIATSCPVCVRSVIERPASNEDRQETFEKRIEVLITHKRSGHGVCAKGHAFILRVAEPAYALVFDRALQRLVDGDERDAVIDAYTALDMYMSTVPVRARYDRDPRLTHAHISSLRQELSFATSDASKALGAGFAVASVVSGQPPPKFPTKLAQLRNHAVHAGEYPTQKEAEWAITEVERIVTSIDDLLTAAAPDRNPTFRLAAQVADFPSQDSDSDGAVTVGLSAVLSGASEPREKAVERIARYRTGDLSELRFY